MRGQILPDGCHSDHSPPEGVSVAIEVSPAPGAHSVLSRGSFGMKQDANLYLLAEIHEVAGEDEAEEAYVEGSDEFLTVDVDHGAQEAPGAALSVHMQHPGMIIIISCILQHYFQNLRIWRNLIPLTAEAADTLPSLPAIRTKMEAVTTTKSDFLWFLQFLY